jgi:formamidopyrimidine-DNA glycosylase
MPELPEVETIRLGLQKYVVGHKILDVEILNPKSFEGSSQQIIDSRISNVKRFGKGLVIELSNNKALAIHVKMTGQLIYRDKSTEKIEIDKTKVGDLPGKHTRVIFHLNRNAILYFNDIRKFGWIRIIEKDKEKDLPFFKNIGPEPPVAKAMEGQAFLTLPKFQKILEGSSMAIKSLIMDQKKIGGIGNIYANDALFDSKISPKRSANKLSEEEGKKLYKSILKVMEKSLRYGGSSENTYVNVLGTKGDYQRHTLVYGKKGEKCLGCGGEIKRIVVGGRGTFYCPFCQH